MSEPSRTEFEFLMAMYRENTDQARHHESQRATATNLILVVAAALIGLATAKTDIGTDPRIIGWMLMALGIFGALLNLKHYERNRRHATIAGEIRSYLEKRLEDKEIQNLKRIGVRNHKAKWWKPIASWLRLFHLWILLFGFVFAIGCILVVTQGGS